MQTVKLHVTKAYWPYKAQILELPANHHGREILRFGRNVVSKKQINLPGNYSIDVVVKSFAKPVLLKGILNTHFVQSKAKRSLQNAQLLTKLGISTPEPIACIEHICFHSIRESYFLCKFWRHNYDLGNFLYRDVSNVKNTEVLLEELAIFTANQHKMGVYHQDYNPGNILVNVRNSEFSFALVDLNRIKIGNMSMEDRIKGLVRLTPNPDKMEIFARIYYDQMGIQQEDFCYQLLTTHNKFWSRRLQREDLFRRLKLR